MSGPRAAVVRAASACALGACLLPAGGSALQEPPASPAGPSAAYEVQPDTLWYESRNPFRLYWVRGADSLGWGGENSGAEAHLWVAGSDTLRLELTRFALDALREVTEDTFVVSRFGKVLEIHGPGARPDGRWDLLLPLPVDARPLVPGATWRDSLVRTWSDERGDHLYSVVRSLEVWEVADSAGERLARVRSEGEAAMRAAFVVDSATRLVTTLDVRGPIEETFQFDLASGRLVERTWAMHLRGTGVLEVPGEAVDTLPAGLVSEHTLTRSSPERVRSLARPLPGRDTTYAVRFGDASVVAHTAGIAPKLVEGAWADPNGEVSSVTLTLDDGAPVRLSRLLTAPLRPIVEVEVRASAAGPYDDAGAIIEAPAAAEAWAFWVDGHEELLVPMALSLSADSLARPVALWDIEAGRWLEGEGLVLDLEGHTLCVITLEGEFPVLSVLVAPDGELLYAERGSQGERAPLAGSAKRNLVEGLIRRFTDRQGPAQRDPGRRS